MYACDNCIANELDRVGEWAVPPTQSPTAKPPTLADGTAANATRAVDGVPEAQRAGIEPAVAWRTLSMQSCSTRVRAEEAGKLEGRSRGPAQAHASRAHRTDSPSGPRARVRCRFGPGCAPHSDCSKLRTHAHPPARPCVRAHRHSAVLCTVRRCVARAAIAAAIVRSVPSRRVERQRLPAGLLKDRHGGGVRECGQSHKPGLALEYGYGAFLAERLLHVLQERIHVQVQRPSDGRCEPCHAAAVRRCRRPRTAHAAPVSVCFHA
jgi:hypothetical protein